MDFAGSILKKLKCKHHGASGPDQEAGVHPVKEEVTVKSEPGVIQDVVQEAPHLPEQTWSDASFSKQELIRTEHHETCLCIVVLLFC